MVYDRTRGEVVLFGGTGSDDCLEGAGKRNDTWSWNGTAQTRTQRFPTGDIPTRRSSMGMAYDSLRQRVVLFGGDGLSSDCMTSEGRCDDTYTWNRADQTWTKCDPLTQCATRPSARSSGEMAFHADKGLVFIFGGTETGGVLKDDTWAWNGTGWSERSMLSHPPARQGQRLVYYADKKYILMFGGNVATGALDNDTWTLDGGDWVQRFPSDSPSDRCCVGLAYFGGCMKKLFLLGGGIASPAPAQPLIEHWDGTAWSVVQVPQLDWGNDLFGVAAVSSDDVWAVGETFRTASRPLALHWDGTAWTQVPVPAPSDNAGFSAAAVVSPSDVWAVGSAFDDNSDGFRPLTERSRRPCATDDSMTPP